MSRAGSRTARFRPSGMAGFGRIGDDKEALVVTDVTGMCTIKSVSADEFDTENEVTLASEEGNNILFYAPLRGRKPLVWNMSRMTGAELDAFRTFMNHLFDLADPIVRERDRIASEAAAAGDDTYVRNYRPLPQLFTRQREERSDSEGVHDGPEGTPDTAGD